MSEKQKELLASITESFKKMTPELQQRTADKLEGAAETLEYIREKEEKHEKI